MQEYSSPYVSIISPLLNTLKNIVYGKYTSGPASQIEDGELLLQVPADQRTANPNAYEPYLFHFGLYKKPVPIVQSSGPAASYYINNIPASADIQFKQLAAEALFDKSECEKYMADLASEIKAQLPFIKRQYLQSTNYMDRPRADQMLFLQQINAGLDMAAPVDLCNPKSKKNSNNHEEEDFVNGCIAKHLALDAVTIVAAAVLPSESALKTFKAFPILNLVAKDAILLQNQIPVKLLDMVLRQMERYNSRRHTAASSPRLDHGNTINQNLYTLNNLVSWYIHDAGVNPFPRSSVDLKGNMALNLSLLAHMYDHLVRADHSPSATVFINGNNSRSSTVLSDNRKLNISGGIAENGYNHCVSKEVASMEATPISTVSQNSKNRGKNRESPAAVVNAANGPIPENIADNMQRNTGLPASKPDDSYSLINPLGFCFQPTEAALDKGAGIVAAVSLDGAAFIESTTSSSHRLTIDSLPSLPSASDLRSCGVKFRPCDGKFDNISFDPCSCVLSLPPLVINDVTLRFLLNLLAYEATQRFPAQCSVVSYVYFMDRLIDTANDVSLLAEAGVIMSSFGSHAEVAEAWNRLLVAVTPLVTEKDEKTMAMLREVTKVRWRRKWADFKKTYWDDKPWLVVSIIVGFFLLVMTVLQTMFTILSYVKPIS